MALTDGTPDPERNTLRLPPRNRRLAAGAFMALLLAGPASAFASDPTPAPAVETARPPTCAERYPEEGPAGVDLRLGCIVGSVVGAYTTAQTGNATPLSSYAIILAGLVAAGILAVWLAGRFVARRAGERLAPVTPGEWWVCTSCKSVNGGHVARCYSCGSPRPAGPTMTTDEHPEIQQSFGSTRKRG